MINFGSWSKYPPVYSHILHDSLIFIIEQVLHAPAVEIVFGLPALCKQLIVCCFFVFQSHPFILSLAQQLQRGQYRPDKHHQTRYTEIDDVYESHSSSHCMKTICNKVQMFTCIIKSKSRIHIFCLICDVEQAPTEPYPSGGNDYWMVTLTPNYMKWWYQIMKWCSQLFQCKVSGLKGGSY